jgi:hypothetical protein
MAGPVLMPSREQTVDARLMRACRAGVTSSRMAKESGASGPLAAPWRIRASTNWIDVVASVSRTRPNVKMARAA